MIWREYSDRISSRKLFFDLLSLVFHGGITSEQLSIEQINTDTAIAFMEETLAILIGVDANNLMDVSNFV